MDEQATEEQASTKETVILHTAGAIPGIPGTHGAGRYEVDWEARTATPIVDEAAPAPEKEAEQEEADNEPLEPVAQPAEEAAPAPIEEAPPEQTTTEESAQA